METQKIHKQNIAKYLKTIKGQLIGMSVMLAITIAVLLSISLYLVNHTTKITNKVINMRTPCTLNSIILMDGLNNSLAALRGYVIMGNQKFIDKRKEAWAKDIKEPLAKLKTLDVCWEGTQDKILLDSSIQQLERLEQYQQIVEDIAQKPENIPANQILNENINPLAETLFADITALINSIGGGGALDAKHKESLMLLAETRGAQGMAVANIKTYAITGDAEHLKAYNKYWESTKTKWAALAEKMSLLNVSQAESFRNLTEERTKIEAYTEKLIVERNKEDWNKAIYWLSTKAAPTAMLIDANLDKIMSDQQALMAKESNEIEISVNTQKSIAYFLLIFGIVASILIGLIISRKVLGAIYKLRDYILLVGKGELPEALKVTEDETGEMITATNVLVSNLKNVREFAIEVGHGKFDTDINVFNNEGALGSALAEMRDSLKKVSEEEKKRNWATEGLARFGEILRANTSELKELAQHIISNLVKYLKANQGGLFVVNDNNSQDIYLELVAYYAFEKKKYITQRIAKGEGLVGQAWQEGDYTYITDIPNDYVKITSGVGGANPRSVLIVPLKINETVLGVVEIASFNPFEKHEIEFVQKLSESIASTLSTAKVNERTKRLLHESQQQSEELKAQEEEMRQNMEELAATQEETQRKERTLQQLLEASKAQEEELRQNMEEMSAKQEEMERIHRELEDAKKNSLSKAQKFREQMEKLDFELEDKKAQIQSLKKTIETLNQSNV